MKFNEYTLKISFFKEHEMRANQDLIGKTITGVVAVTQPGEEVREIWMLQFSDGSHVEFVSPMARRRLRRRANTRKAVDFQAARRAATRAECGLKNLSTKAVDNPVKKAAGSQVSWASFWFDQKLTTLNIVY